MTKSEIRDLLRVFIDQPNTAIWSDSKLNSLVNGSYREIVREIMRRNPKYYVKSSSVSTTSGTPFTDIPSDCVLINKITNSSNETLVHMDTTQMDMDETGEPTNFDVTGAHIFWWPKPTGTYTFTAYYHYMPSDMSTDSATPELPSGYHDIIAYGAAITSRMAKEDKIDEYVMKYEKNLQLLLRTIMVSQTNESPRIKGCSHDFYLFD